MIIRDENSCKVIVQMVVLTQKMSSRRETVY